MVSLDERVQVAELGWVLGSQWWGNNYMPEALEAVTHFLLEEVGCLRITAVHDSENRPSGRVMEKVGMTYEGTLRQALEIIVVLWILPFTHYCIQIEKVASSLN